MKISKEPLTQAQRAELEGVVATSTQAMRIILFTLFVFVLGIFLRWVQGLFGSGHPFWIIATLAVATWCYSRSSLWHGGNQYRSEVRDDLSEGQVTVSMLEPKSVEEIKELEDEGPTFIIHEDDDAMYLLTGQEMAKHKLDGFPWSSIGVLETPHSKTFLGLRKMGEPVSVSVEHEPLTYQQAKELGCFESSFIGLDEKKKHLINEITLNVKK